MKTSHIIAILVIAGAIAVLVATTGDASTYGDFDQAYEMASTGNQTAIHVVGELKKDAHGNILGLEKSEDRLSFTFVLVDSHQKEQKVFYQEPMPPDFLRSEKVVVIGKYHGDQFVASKILLKCPSKYQETKLSASLLHR